MGATELPDRDISPLLLNLSNYSDCASIKPHLKLLKSWFKKVAGNQVSELVCSSSWLAMLDDAPDAPHWGGRGTGAKRQSLGADVSALMVGKRLLRKARQNLEIKESQDLEGCRQAVEHLQDTRQQQRLWMNRSSYKGKNDQNLSKQKQKQARRRSRSSSRSGQELISTSTSRQPSSVKQQA